MGSRTRNNEPRASAQPHRWVHPLLLPRSRRDGDTEPRHHGVRDIAKYIYLYVQLIHPTQRGEGRLQPPALPSPSARGQPLNPPPSPSQCPQPCRRVPRQGLGRGTDCSPATAAPAPRVPQQRQRGPGPALPHSPHPLLGSGGGQEGDAGAASKSIAQGHAWVPPTQHETPRAPTKPSPSAQG